MLLPQTVKLKYSTKKEWNSLRSKSLLHDVVEPLIYTTERKNGYLTVFGVLTDLSALKTTLFFSAT